MKNLRMFLIPVLALLLAVVFVFSGCAKSIIDETPGTGMADEYENRNDGDTALSKALTSRKIIKDATIYIETKEFDECIGKIEQLAKSLGGYSEDAKVSNYRSGQRKATYTFRIPEDKFETFILFDNVKGQITSKYVSNKDITDEYYDIDARIRALETEEERILDILGKATQMSDILQIEKHLTQIRKEIEDLKGALAMKDSLIELSTVNVEVSEVAFEKFTSQSFFAQVANVFIGSLNALMVFLRFFGLFLVAILPFAVFFGAVTFIIIFIVKKLRRKNKDK